MTAEAGPSQPPAVDLDPPMPEGGVHYEPPDYGEAEPQLPNLHDMDGTHDQPDANGSNVEFEGDDQGMLDYGDLHDGWDLCGASTSQAQASSGDRRDLPGASCPTTQMRLVAAEDEAGKFRLELHRRCQIDDAELASPKATKSPPKKAAEPAGGHVGRMLWPGRAAESEKQVHKVAQPVYADDDDGVLSFDYNDNVQHIDQYLRQQNTRDRTSEAVDTADGDYWSEEDRRPWMEDEPEDGEDHLMLAVDEEAHIHRTDPVLPNTTAPLPKVPNKPGADRGQASAKLYEDVMRMYGGLMSDSDEDDVPDAALDGQMDGLDKTVLEPAWEFEGKRCPLKVLQVLHLLAEYKERHRLTGPALEQMLRIIKFILPDSNLPATMYMFKKMLREVLVKQLGSTGYKMIHVCADPECEHVYNDDERQCPRIGCGKDRYIKQPNGREKPARTIRYMGLRQGMQLMLMSRVVCSAMDAFDVRKMLDRTYSFYSSQLSDHIAIAFVPGFADMLSDEQREVKAIFYKTGQFCTEEQFLRMEADIAAGRQRPSRLIVLEGGCDGFQPYRRRQWTTWMLGWRIKGIDWRQIARKETQIVTAISEGAVEGKAASVVAALDAQELLRLMPPTAGDRLRDFPETGT